MEHKKVYGIPIFYLMTLVYAISTTILGIIMNNGLIIFLGWNVILATFVYFLASMFVITRTKQRPFWVSYLILILFILFFPNTLYLLTDTIHFQAYTFFADYPSLYALMIEDWVVFTIVTVGMLYGVKLGIHSIDLIEQQIFPFIKKHRIVYLICLFTLSSIGIFLGRFIRLNSWNIWDIESIVFGVFNELSFFIQFVGLFILIHGLCYFLFSSNQKILYNHNKEKKE